MIRVPRLVAAIRALPTVALAGLVAVVMAVNVGVVHAHSGLAAASPGPGSVVGGDLELVELFYGDIITEFDATVTRQSDGVELDAEAVMTSEITGEIRLAAPLSEPGEYAVRHTVLSIDGDVVEAAYLFSYEPEAPEAILVFLDDEGDDGHDDGGWPWWAWAIIAAGALAIIVLAVRLFLAIRRARAVPPADSPQVE